MKFALVIMAAAACQRTERMPDRRDVSAIVGAADRMTFADLDGDGHPELVLVDAEAMRVVDRAGREIARAPVLGGIQVLSVGDLDSDRRAEVLAGWGISREHRDATARVTIHRLDGAKLVEELVVALATTRQDVAAVIARGATLLIAYFDDTYSVTQVTATHSAAGWSTRDPVVIRMATSWAIGDIDGDRHPDVVVGRLYGDAGDRDGDAFVLSPDGARRAIPTLRGVRGLAVADTDGDGRDEIFLGDGWHQDYGQVARGQLTWARLVDREFRSEVIEDTPGQYTIWQILAVDVDGDGKPELITRGSHDVRVYHRSGDRWRGLTIAGAARDIAVGDLDGAGNAIWIAAEHAEVVNLRGVTW